MERFANYILKEKLHEMRNFIVYSGQKENEPRTVIVKVLKAKNPSLSEIVRFKQEYNLIKRIDAEGVVKSLDLIEHKNNYAIVEENFNGIPLKEILKKEKIDLELFLQIGLQLSESLSMLHRNHVIHMDIRPDNILINLKQKKVKITNFGISTVLTHANDELYDPIVIEEILPYVSPEQTGRMNRSVDYRTDIYSLGITFYEMLTGTRPFEAKDPMELIHSHIARQPIQPDKLNPSIPRVISSIIMKLLAKNPEERYQNCQGLMADMISCLNQIGQKDKIEEFAIATKDIPVEINIPPIIIGREKELDALLQSFERISRGTSEIVIVSGMPGIGKTAFVNELYKPIVLKRGYFIFGKFDQFRKDVPYSSIIQAFQSLVRQILTESNEKINLWKDKILSAIGSNGKIITEIFPEMELVIGKQKEVPILGPEETQNRFNLVFQNLIGIFSAKEHPLVLFLDDLQWADLASLNFLKNIMAGNGTKYLLLIGACRNNEVSLYHPLTLTLDEIRKRGKAINSIELAPLDINQVNIMLMNTLRCEAGESMALTEIVYKKTAGNPFFVIQFFKNLYNKDIFKFDPKTGWKWDLNLIEQMQIPDNIVVFMADIISTLREKSLNLIKICSCIGNRFDLETLSIVSEKPIEETLADLTETIEKGLVSLDGDTYKFHHDRIREAAYSLIPDHEKTVMHYKIGNMTLKKTEGKKLFDKIFYIVGHLNRGISLISRAKEKIRLARLNFLACKKAKNSTAYASAAVYARTADALLPHDCWIKHYDLAYELSMERMECEYLTLNFTEAEKIFKEIMKNAKTDNEKTRGYILMILLYGSMAKYKESLALGIEAMRMIGSEIPEHVTKGMIVSKLIRLYFQFKKSKIKIEDIIDLPPATDPKNVIWHLLAINTGTVAYYYDTNIWSYVIIEGVSKILNHGNYEYSGLTLSTFGSILGAGLGFYQQGYRFAVTGMKVNEKLDSKKSIGLTIWSFAAFVQHWTKHAKYDLDLIREGYKNCLEVGNVIFAHHAVNVLCATRIILGDGIDDIMEENEKYKSFQLGSKDPFVALNYRINAQMLLCLKGLTDTPGHLNTADFDEEDVMRNYRKSGLFLGIFFLLLIKIRVYYLFGEYDNCVSISAELYDLVVRREVARGYLHITEANFYSSLAMAALYPEAKWLGRRKYKRIIRLNQKRMKLWAKNCPENFLHKYLLVEAEMALINHQFKKAKNFYDEAIKSANENGYTQNEGIASERAALLMKKMKNIESTKQYMIKAHSCYAKWGALSKIRQLETKYPELLGNVITYDAKPAPDSTGLTSLSRVKGMQALDISTIIKTSLAISSEINLGSLLEIIMKLSIENAGAQKGFMILKKEEDNKLYIEAENSNEKEIIVLKSIPVDNSVNLSVAIVNYVSKTKQPVILNDATSEGAFTQDKYIIEHKPKSILCTPIIHKGEVTGIIYLENNLTTNAFTPERLELLQILSSQAAISIENAELYKRAVTDGLTGIYNRTFFDNYLMKCLSNAKRYKRNLCLLMIDIDNFKQFNDKYGHQTGDKVLKSVAQMINNSLRNSDLVARYGGEEFVAVLTETKVEDAKIVAEKIKNSIEENSVEHLKSTIKKKLNVTVSIGIAEFIENENRIELIERADKNMYRAKKVGKNAIAW